jgi:hypothetical protein
MNSGAVGVMMSSSVCTMQPLMMLPRPMQPTLIQPAAQSIFYGTRQILAPMTGFQQQQQQQAWLRASSPGPQQQVCGVTGAAVAAPVTAKALQRIRCMTRSAGLSRITYQGYMRQPPCRATRRALSAVPPDGDRCIKLPGPCGVLSTRKLLCMRQACKLSCILLLVTALHCTADPVVWILLHSNWRFRMPPHDFIAWACVGSRCGVVLQVPAGCGCDHRLHLLDVSSFLQSSPQSLHR